MIQSKFKDPHVPFNFYVRARSHDACMLHDQRGERLQLQAAGAGGRGGVDLPQLDGAARGREAPAQGAGLGAQPGVAEPDQRGAGLHAAEARGELAVAGAEPGGARAELLQVPLFARAGPPRRLPVRDLAPETALVGRRRRLLLGRRRRRRRDV